MSGAHLVGVFVIITINWYGLIVVLTLNNVQRIVSITTVIEFVTISIDTALAVNVVRATPRADNFYKTVAKIVGAIITDVQEIQGRDGG